jgi:hypothetical protein
VIDMVMKLPLPEGRTVDTSGLTVRAAGTTLSAGCATIKQPQNAYLLMSYKGGVRQ